MAKVRVFLAKPLIMPITEDDLKSILWEDISIQDNPQYGKVLILICGNKVQAIKLLQMLHENAFNLKIGIDSKSKRYHLALSFSNSEYAIGCDTGKTEKQYPPLGWLKKQMIKSITTGIWTGETPDGFRISWYDLNFKSLEGININ